MPIKSIRTDQINLACADWPFSASTFQHVVQLLSNRNIFHLSSFRVDYHLQLTIPLTEGLFASNLPVSHFNLGAFAYGTDIDRIISLLSNLEVCPQIILPCNMHEQMTIQQWIRIASLPIISIEAIFPKHFGNKHIAIQLLIDLDNSPFFRHGLISEISLRIFQNLV